MTSTWGHYVKNGDIDRIDTLYPMFVNNRKNKYSITDLKIKWNKWKVISLHPKSILLCSILSTKILNVILQYRYGENHFYFSFLHYR